MEIYELRYFIAVAQVENVNQAAKNIAISAGSLSKAIARLEEELQTPLFYRVGRGIKLTPAGLALKTKATALVESAGDLIFSIKAKSSSELSIYISSEEILQPTFGFEISKKIHKVFPEAKVHFYLREELKAIEQIKSREAHLAIISGPSPKNCDSKNLNEVQFQTCSGKNHPLFKKYGTNKPIPVAEVLQHPFALPDRQVLGAVPEASNLDGWRDDKFPRKVKYKVSSLKILEKLVRTGSALAYLPHHFIEDNSLSTLKVKGCPYSCRQKIKIICKKDHNLSWLTQLWDKL